MDLERWRALSSSMRTEHFSARTFDAGGALTTRRCEEAREALRLHGALFVQNTGLRGVEALQAVMPALGFSPETHFTLGGRTSAATQEKWVAPGLRRMDFYPPDLYLLPNNEVQYRRTSPRWVLFGCLQPASDGGRVFLHDAREVERLLPRALMEKFERHGLSIETGFLDEAHPEKASNYFQSWQERFGTTSRDEAFARAREARDEYDEVWWRDDGTLMTRITLPARCAPRGPLRFPRVALDAPSARNGYRRFPLGNGESLSAEEEDAIRAAFLASRQGVPLQTGELVLFDNQRFGHSRESFSGAREFVVGMANDSAPHAPSAERFAPAPPNRYALRLDTQATFSANSLSLGERGGVRGETADLIHREFARHGALHLKRTGLQSLDAATLDLLGFGERDAFAWGGANCGRTTRKELTKELRATDAYPAHLWLLPHNEVLYQRELPARLLFFASSACVGRTFVHSAERFREQLELRAPALIESLREHGMLIEMGFIDEHHPERASNYFRSWQDRFETSERAEAETRCRAATHQFDACWWRDDGTLMTRIKVPAFHGETMLFPRIPLDPPSIQNGFRRYPKGNGEELTDDEVNALLHAFLETREGVPWEPGDLLLVDNLRFGHSREPCGPDRNIGVAMAGRVTL